jgi:hypothetical protein
VTLSGTFTFGIATDQLDVITEAYERIGRVASQLSGNDIDSGTRSLAYLMQSEWSNKQPNLWTITQRTSALTQGQTSITLNTYDIYITEAFTRTTSGGVNNDLIISPMSRSEYAAIPNKAQQSTRPTQFYLQRTITPTVFIWPTPQDATVTLVYNVATMVDDPGALSNTLNAPNRWFDALAAELAARLAVKWARDRAVFLREEADKAYTAAAAEDSENVPLSIVPNFSYGRRGG